MPAAIDKQLHISYTPRQGNKRRNTMQAYCMKCRKKVEMKNAKATTLKNKRPATQGVCPSCGTKVFRIGKG
jgi:hypothetical protein